jgi:hypothetical protein
MPRLEGGYGQEKKEDSQTPFPDEFLQTIPGIHGGQNRKAAYDAKKKKGEIERGPQEKPFPANPHLDQEKKGRNPQGKGTNAFGVGNRQDHDENAEAKKANPLDIANR